MSPSLTRMRPRVASRTSSRGAARRTTRPLDEPVRALLASHSRAIYRFAMNMAESPRVASDIVFDTVATALDESRLLTSRDHLTRWVWNLAAESAVEACSRRGLRLVTPTPVAPDRSAFASVLASLSIEDRTAYLLHEIEELSDADVAWILETTESDVRQRVHHVRLCLCPLVADLAEIEAA